MININDMFKAVQKWANATAFRNTKAEVVEAADFGDFYGFLFANDKYNNAYWCIDKKTYKMSMFLPEQDLSVYNKRIVFDIRGSERRKDI